MSDVAVRDVSINALGLDFRGWSDDLATSGLSAMHVTTCVPWDSSAGFFGYTNAMQQVSHETMEMKRRIRDSSGRVYHVDSVADLDRIGTDGKLGLVLGLQDMTGFDFHPRLAEVLRELGLRIIQPAYNYANLFADGYMEDRDAGLSAAGRQLVRALNEAGISLDVSHVGIRSAFDVVEVSSLPVAATHVNRRAVIENRRNKPDDLLREIAASGGVVGVAALGPMIWDRDPGRYPTMQDVVEHVLSMLELLGADAVGIGTDHMVSPDPDNDPVPGWWRNGVPGWARTRKPTSFGEFGQTFRAGAQATMATNYPKEFETIAGFGLLPQRLRDAGLPDDTVQKVLGQNWIRFFRNTWK